MPTLNEQMDVISMGTEEIIPQKQLEAQISQSIKENVPLRVKLGCDPSKPDLHIGHAVLLRKLRQFQDFGHTAILIIGDFTAMIGEPTGKNKQRPQITLDETKTNAKTYIDQATSILDKSNPITSEKNNNVIAASNEPRNNQNSIRTKPIPKISCHFPIICTFIPKHWNFRHISLSATLLRQTID